MTNKELEKKLCSAFEEATPDVLGSVLADCRKEQKTMVSFTNTAMTNWTKKFAFSAAAAVLVICLSLGMGNIFGGIDPTDPTEPFQTGTEPTDTQPSEPRPSGPVDEDTLSVDWSMTASVIQPDGTVVKNHSMTVKGTIEVGDPYCYHNLNIQLDEDFRFMHTGAEPDGDICTNRWAQWPGDFTYEGFCYDKITNSPELVAWAVNTQKEYFIAWFGEEYGMYVVAATDPAVQPDEILAHFEMFVERYKPTDPEPTDPEPTDPEPVAPDELPDDLNTDTDTVAKFQELFEYSGWYAQALAQYYTHPADMMLHNFLYGVGFKDEPAVTEDERIAIVAMTEIDDYLWMDAKRFSVGRINSLLNEMFGISLDDMNEDALKLMYYLESTDSYYYFNSGSKTADPVTVVGTRVLENGRIELYYQIGQNEAEGLNRGYAILEQSGNGYHIVCNLHAGNGAWPEPAPEIPENFPADLNIDRDVVAKFQKLFDNDSWYTQALFEEFDDPRNIGLTDFLFCDMKPWPYTKHTMVETEKLRQQFGITEEWWVDCFSIEASTVEEVLQTVFGYSFADFMDSNNPYIRYMKSTDRYYYGRSDSSLVWNVSVVGIRELEDGNIEVYYSCDWLYPEDGVVTLKPVGDSYHILSNMGI